MVLIDLSRNVGKEPALTAGLEAARSEKRRQPTWCMGMAHFGVPALTGWAVNEVTFVLLRVVGWPSWLTAGQTLVLSRLWAFRR